MTKIILATPGLVEIISIVMIVIALIFSISAVYRRLTNMPNWHRYRLIVLNLIAFLAFLGLIIQPQYQTNQNLTVTLYSDFSKKFVNDENSFFLSAELFKTTDGERIDPMLRNQDKVIQSANQILLKVPSMSQLKIIGDGLTESQWQNLPNIKIDYQVPALTEGILQPQWNSSIGLGDELVFSGRLQSSSQKIYQAKLLDPAGQIVAETELLAGQLFYLSAQPKLIGNHQYKLRLTDHKNRILSEQIIPVSVIIGDSAKILVLQSSPSFETKQLQNWAAENGSQFLLRSRISKNHFSARSTNITKDQRQINSQMGLSRQLFDQFDLLIVDGRELLSMTAKQQNELQLSIKNGLGVLILADQELMSISKDNMPPLLIGFEIKAISQPTEIIPYIVSEDSKRKILSDNFIPLAGQSIGLATRNSTLQSLVQASQGHFIVAQTNRDLGKVAVSLLRETHRLVTSGQKMHYGRLWQHLIKRIARRNTNTKIRVNSGNHLSYDGDQVEICYLRSQSTQPPVNSLQVINHSYEDSQTVLLKNDRVLNNQHCGYFWPQYSGWYKIFSTGPSELITSQFYISQKHAWPAYQQQNKIMATQTKQADFIQDNIKSKHYKKINEWVFWWMIIISASLIWLERKYSSAE